MPEKELAPFYAQQAKCRYLPNTMELCPKGQFVYFVGNNLVKS